MDRAQAAHGRSLGRSCCFNRFATRDDFDGARVLRDSYSNAAGTGGILPQSAIPLAPSRDEEIDHDAIRQVDLRDLWDHLPKEEQMRFSSCFSRMILKMLNQSDGTREEDQA